MMDRQHNLSLTRQSRLLGISRGSIYYKPRPTSQADLSIMRRIDELNMEYPFAGSRMLKGLLRQRGLHGWPPARGHVDETMEIEAIYRRPNTSKPHPEHKIYPYLLRNVVVARPNQAWAMDITYVSIRRGFVYLAAVIDWFTRKVLAWRVSITLETSFCIETVEDAMARYGKPEIFNTPSLALLRNTLPGNGSRQQIHLRPY